MYVVQVVQSGRGLLSAGYGSGRQQKPQCSRGVSSEALKGREGLSHGVIYMPPSCGTPQAAAPDALTCQPTRTTVMPWLRQIAMLMRTHEQMQPPAFLTRCSSQDSNVSVMTAAPNSPSTTPNTNTMWGEGPDPLVIHLPGADGTAESSPADPASGGLPNTPTVVSDNSKSLTLRDPSPVQRRPPAGELRLRPGSSGSRTLPSMLQRRPDTLQARPAPGAPARTSGAGSLQPKVPNPLGFLPSLQWGSSSTYWGSPIGGTLWVNPPVESTPQAAHHQQQQQQLDLTKRSGMYWGSPIGGTLFINPSVDEPPSSHSPAAAAALNAAATISSSTLPGVSKKSKTFGQWGSPIGGTLFINPSADWHEGPWGNSGSSSGSRSGGSGGSPAGGNGTAPGAGSESRGGDGGTSSKGSIGAVASKQPAGGYVGACAAAHPSWGSVPPGVGLAKLGVGLMAAMAGAMLVVYLKAGSSASNNSNTAANAGKPGRIDARSGPTPAPAAVGAGAGGKSATAGAAAPGPSGTTAVGPEGVGFHQWMVQRLQNQIESFETEQAMLKTELAVLNSIPAANSAGKGVLGPFKRWLGSSSSNVSGGSSTSSAGAVGEALAEGAAAAAAVSGGVTARMASLSPANISARVAEIQEQIESLDVLSAALGVELTEQQQQLAKAQQDQQAAQEQLTALAGRQG